MALQSNIQIYIGGNAIHAFKRLTLHQEIDSHHLLELVCRMDVLEEISVEIASESRNFLGEIVTVQVTTLDNLEGYKELEFKGVVTSVNNTKAFHQGVLVRNIVTHYITVCNIRKALGSIQVGLQLNMENGFFMMEKH